MSTAETLTGLVATVCTAIRGGDRPGEIRVVVDGLPHCYLAYCAQELPIGQQVLIINRRGPRMVDVEAWSSDRFGAPETYGIAQPQG